LKFFITVLSFLHLSHSSFT